MKKLIFCILLCLLCSGCGSYRELNDLVIVSGGGLEQREGQPLTLTAQLVTLPEGEDAPQTELVQTKGATPVAALDALPNLTGKPAYWSHAQTFLLGEDLSRNGLSQTVDTLLAEPEIRLTDRLLVTAGTDPKAVLEASAAGGEISGYDLYTLLSSDTTNLDMPLYRFADALFTDGIDPCLPAVTLNTEGQPILLGTAIFQGDHLAGYLNRDQTQTLLLLTGRIRSLPLTVASARTYTLDKAGCQITPTLTEQGLVFTVELQVTARSDSVGCSAHELRSELRSRIRSLFSILQTDLQADPLGLMRQAQRYLKLPDTKPTVLYSASRLRTEVSVTLSPESEVNVHA